MRRGGHQWEEEVAYMIGRSLVRGRGLEKLGGHQWEWEVAYNRGRLPMRRGRSALREGGR